jgi:hypothetical protein
MFETILVMSFSMLIFTNIKILVIVEFESVNVPVQVKYNGYRNFSILVFGSVSLGIKFL